MLASSTALVNTIQQALAVSASPRVTLEWNHNRYTPISNVDNWGHDEATYGYDLETFPISEITKPLRPTSGILLGKTGEGVTTSGYSDQPGSYRTYTASPTSKYKYWTSPERSNSSGALANCSPFVTYSQAAWANKIYACFENSWASPTTYDIQVTTDGTNWVTVASNIAPNSKGQVSLYRQADGSWNGNAYYGNPQQLLGVRLAVYGLSRASAHLNLIELGLRLQDDVTPYLISYSVDAQIGNGDFISPIGDANSNVGSVVLSNLDGRFNPDAPSGSDPTPLYRGLIDRNVHVYIDLGIDTGSYGGSGVEYLRLATMVTDDWGSNDEQSTLTLKDYSKFLQEMNPAAMLMTDVTIGQAIWRLLDSVGFNSYQYTRGANESAAEIPFFWTDVTKTVWETIQDICRTTQTAVYFDASGVLQIKTREATFDKTKATSWTLDYNANGSKQPDIISLTPGNNYEANHVTVNYRPTATAKNPQGLPAPEVVWQPGDANTYVNGQLDTDTTVVLRASGLAEDMNSSQMYFKMNQLDAITWPYEGMVNIRGELIRYKGKEYRYIDKSNNWQYTTVSTADEKQHIDKDLSSPTLGFQNYFTGKFTIVERGYDWTSPASHDTTIQSWLNAGPAYGSTTGGQTTWTGGLHHLRGDSILRMQGASSWGAGTFYTAPHGSQFKDAAPNNIGTRFRFPSSPKGSAQIGGIFFYGNSANNVMYTVEVMTTSWLEGRKLRTSRDEIMIVRRDGSGYNSIVGRGMATLIAEDTWYDLDITVKGNVFTVFLNGLKILSMSDSTIAPTGKLGMYIRGYTVMDFEYFYYAANAGWPDPDSDNSSYLDLIRGGYYSDQHYKDGFYRTRTARRKAGKRSITYKQNYAQRFFDEFGILVHEVRPYTVAFSKGPVIYSDITFTNTYQAVNLEYIGNAYGASFILANASRDDATLSGDDALTYGSNNVISQKMYITGLTIQQQDPKKIEVKDTSAILRRGDIPLDFTSDWLQTEAAAQQLANWIVNNWSNPADEVQVEVFGNPLLELTDVVGVNFPLRNMTAATHKYYITDCTHSYADGGLSTSLNLRRAR